MGRNMCPSGRGKMWKSGSPDKVHVDPVQDWPEWYRIKFIAANRNYHYPIQD